MKLFNLVTGTNQVFPVNGGRFQIKAAAGSWGSGTMTVKWCESADGTFVPVPSSAPAASTSTLGADGSLIVECARGFFQFSITGTLASVFVGFAQSNFNVESQVNSDGQ